LVIALPLHIVEINGQLTFSNDFFTQPLAMKYVRRQHFYCASKLNIIFKAYNEPALVNG